MENQKMTYKIDRFICFYNYDGPCHGSIPFSVIDFYHLTFVFSGNVSYKVNGKEIILGENDALILPPGTKRERYKSDVPAHYVIFNYHPTKGNEISSVLLMRNAVNSTIRNLLASYPYTYYNVDDCKIDDKGENLKIIEILPNLFNCILTELFDTLKYKTKNLHVLNAIKYVNDNITKPLSLNTVSAAIHLSREYTTRIFKKEMGLTLTEYINKQKMILAQNMLTNNEMTLQEIAYWLGYDNYGYFSKVFKSCFGISPMKMKIELKNQ